MKVLVTGGSGYIGRATIEALIAAGHGVEHLPETRTRLRACERPGPRP